MYCSYWHFCGLDVCAAGRFPNPPCGFCFTLQSLPATLTWRSAEGKGLGKCQAGTSQQQQWWAGHCVWHTGWFQAVSDTCHSVTPAPFLTPSSHYLEGYVLQERSLSDSVSCCLISVLCSREIFLITMTLLMAVPLCCPFITPLLLYLLDEIWHSQQTLLN